MVILPEDLVEEIISFIFDRRGYDMIEYEKCKKDDLSRRKRINKEFLLWKIEGLSIGWLRPTRSQRSNSAKFLNSLKNGNAQVCYHTGFYSHILDEERSKGLFNYLR